MKTFAYIVCAPSGKVETIRCPSMFGPYEVAERLTHHLVFLRIPSGSSMYPDVGRPIEPKRGSEGFALIHQGKSYGVPLAPTNDHEAYKLYREYGPSTETIAQSA